MKHSAPANPVTDTTFSSARSLSDQAIGHAEKIADSSRALAVETMDRAEGTLRHLRDSIDPVVGRLTAQSQKLARQSLDMASEASARAQRSLHRYADSTTRYVANEPVKAVLIAAAIGAGVALLVSAVRHRDVR